MKYLQIYDHNGNLTKEFSVYVEGQDFSWVSDKPEAIWLGTILLAAEPSRHLVKPTPEPEPEAEAIEPEAVVEVEAKDMEAMEADLKQRDAEKEVKHEPEKRVHKSRRKSRAKPPDGSEGAETVSE